MLTIFNVPNISRMKVVPTVVTKGPKMPKERPKPNAQRVQKIQNLKVTEFKTKKIEKSVGQPTR